MYILITVPIVSYEVSGVVLFSTYYETLKYGSILLIKILIPTILLDISLGCF